MKILFLIIFSITICSCDNIKETSLLKENGLLQNNINELEIKYTKDKDALNNTIERLNYQIEEMLAYIAFINKVDTNKMADVVCGVWLYGFPGPDQKTIYVFYSNNEFIYDKNHHQDENDKLKGLFGKWRIKNTKIEIFIEKYIYLKDKINYGPIGYASSFESNMIAISNKKPAWIGICDLRSLTYYWYPGVDNYDMPKLDIFQIKAYNNEASIDLFNDIFCLKMHREGSLDLEHNELYRNMPFSK